MDLYVSQKGDEKYLSIVFNNEEKFEIGYSEYDVSFEYRVGEVVYADDFNDNRFNECTFGIHFFITLQEAIDY